MVSYAERRESLSRWVFGSYALYFFMPKRALPFSKKKSPNSIFMHLEYEGLLADKVLDLEAVVPIGLTAHNASF